MHYVIQPIMSKGQPDWAESATIISRHRTAEAAFAAIDKANARLRRQAGMSQSWVDWHVVSMPMLSPEKRASHGVSSAARAMGRKGGKSRSDAKTAAVRENGAKGGRPGPSLAAQALVVWTELTTDVPSRMTLGPRLTAFMLDQCALPQIGMTPDSAARLIRERAGKRTSPWITATARKLG